MLENDDLDKLKEELLNKYKSQNFPELLQDEFLLLISSGKDYNFIKKLKYNYFHEKSDFYIHKYDHKDKAYLGLGLEWLIDENDTRSIHEFSKSFQIESAFSPDIEDLSDKLNPNSLETVLGKDGILSENSNIFFVNKK